MKISKRDSRLSTHYMAKKMVVAKLWEMEAIINDNNINLINSLLNQIHYFQIIV